MLSWEQQRVVVTGGKGFLGSCLTQRLRELRPAELFSLGREDYDLMRSSEVGALFEDLRPTIVLHLAAVVGGIGANRENPGRFFYENLMMGAQVIEQARRAAVGKLVVIGTICSYPRLAKVPFREEELWTGYPEETNAPYGIAKLASLVQLQAYRRQYDLNGIYLMPVNLYGPGDNFDPASSHVVPALIRKCFEAKESGAPSVSVWGSGTATREFLYVEDAAEGILRAAELYDEGEPVNLGSGREISIRELAEMIAREVGYQGELVFDRTQPDGQPRRSLDTNRARNLFSFEARTGLGDGLERVVDWYRSNVSHRAI
jgi:GDP-L-fucose synthase